MIDLMQAITNLGDSGLLLPASFCIFFYLLFSGAHSVALIWAAVLTIGLGTTLFAKLGLHACGAEAGFSDLRSPSGHTAFGAIFFGCGSLLAGLGRPAWQRLVLLCAAVVLVLLVGISRVALHFHTAEEVVIGLAIGSACTALFAWVQTRVRSPEISLRPVVVGFVVLVVLLSGYSLNAEPLIRDIAYKLRITMNVCT
jgi:membrane-associated phospholipid phosphatase